jgi:uncharacterized protein (DUF58 family)
MKSSTPAPDPQSGSAFGLVALGILAVFAGVFHRQAFAVAFGLPLLAAPLAARLYVRLALRQLRVERHAPRTAFENDGVTVRIRVLNPGPLPVFFPAVGDVFTPEVHAQKTIHFPARLGAGDEVEDGYFGRCLLPRGVYELPPLAIAVSDPFGWCRMQRHAAGAQTMRIYPRILDLGLPESLGAVAGALLEGRSCPRIGESLEYLGVRDYRLGDSPRKIHWPLTAHRGSLMVREYQRPASGQLTIAIDLCREALIGVGRGSSIEHGIKVAVALAHHALKRGRRVQFLARDRQERVLPPAGGRAQMHRLLELSTELRPQGEMPLPELLGRHRSSLRRGDALVALVSPYLFDSGALLDELARICRLGVRVACGVFDDDSFTTLTYGEIPQPGARLAFLARLRALGIASAVIACGMDLSRLFDGAVGDSSRRGGGR